MVCSGLTFPPASRVAPAASALSPLSLAGVSASRRRVAISGIVLWCLLLRPSTLQHSVPQVAVQIARLGQDLLSRMAVLRGESAPRAFFWVRPTAPFGPRRTRSAL